MSAFQKLVERALHHYLPNEGMYSNFRPDWLQGMEIDVFIPRLKLGIEINGKQHYLWCPDLQPNVEDFLAQRRRDKLKNKILSRNGCILLIVRQKTHELGKLRHKLQRIFKVMRKQRHLDGLGNVPRTSPEILKDWEAYFSQADEYLSDKPLIKVKRGMMIATHKAGKDFLQNETGLSCIEV